MSKKVVIIGGGIMGVCSAYFLNKEGHEVTIIDKSNFSSGASFVNAGYITPSHIISLAAPGIITKGLKWMFNPSSPFYVKPRLDKDFLQWAWAFKRSSTKQKVAQSIPVIKDINILSRELYIAMKSSGDLDFHYEHKGLLMAYKHDKAGEQEWEVGKKAIQLGLKVENLTAKEVEILEPKANLNIKGAVYFHSDAHMTPGGFMKNMLAYLKSQGVAILAEEEVKDIIISNNSIKKVITNKQEITADEFVMAAGSWSPLISKKLGIKMLLQPGKGYRINVAQETNITIPAVLLEAKVAVTPMNGFTRFSGTMEIDKINHKINPIRVNAIANSASEYYKGLQISTEDKEAAQCGLRPVTPDGLPYIGKTTQYNNLTFATGHAMMGWSLGPATGKLVSEIISNQKSSLDLNPFKVQRRF
ncbi:MAG: FAD-dependent oxidoreductase [Flavobacterium sp.]|jgi:D-amino-acid dehydrogenase|nr:FAD-dependent oxidoreductase [Flavobacterium sp.]